MNLSPSVFKKEKKDVMTAAPASIMDHEAIVGMEAT